MTQRNDQPAVRRPFVTIHYATTLDGRIATSTGHSRWISGEAALRFAHQLRADHDAVLVGVGTVIADDPRLTVRLVPGRSPLRVVVDSTLRLPLEARVLVDRLAPTLVATTERAAPERISAVRQRGAEVLTIPSDASGRVSLGDLLRSLTPRGISSVLIEGGREIITSTLRERLANRVVVCIAPKVIGTGIAAIGDLGICHLADALTLADVRVTRLGPDVIVDGRLAREIDRAAA